MFMYEGKVHIVNGADARCVIARRLHDGADVVIPNSHFLGFKTFEYPTMGYRRLSDKVVAFLSRVQSTHRGLRAQSISIDYSPVVRKLSGDYLMDNPARLADKAARAVFEPDWDSKADLPALLAGDKISMVLNEHVLIEPSVNASHDWYSIYYNQALVGSMNSRGVPSINNKHYEKLITPLLKAA
jgi:hypothetical protein